ncbi:hypothetical protein PENTCL1PPCAC_14153, partial [Pristionchus entomophagus]
MFSIMVMLIILIIRGLAINAKYQTSWKRLCRTSKALQTEVWYMYLLLVTFTPVAIRMATVHSPIIFLSCVAFSATSLLSRYNIFHSKSCIHVVFINAVHCYI